MSGLGPLIRAKREREGLSLRDAGKASGVAFSTLARIELGAEPSLRVHQNILAWLDGKAPVLPTPPMTLHDWFAGQALAGITGNHEWVSRVAAKGDNIVMAAAGSAYEYADAMLALRARGTQQ